MDIEKVLGLLWDPKSDSFMFKPKLRVKVKLKEGGFEVHEISSVADLLKFKEFLP